MFYKSLHEDIELNEHAFIEFEFLAMALKTLQRQAEDTESEYHEYTKSIIKSI